MSGDLKQKLEQAINQTSAENGSNTPDFILAEFLTDCLAAWNGAAKAREKWYGRSDQPGIASAQSSSGALICEQHPWRDWPHEACAGPGCSASAQRTLMESLVRHLRQALRERDVLVVDAIVLGQSASVTRELLAEIAKLPSPVIKLRDNNGTTFNGYVRCRWCRKEWQEHTPPFNLHPANGCLWHRAHAADAAAPTEPESIDWRIVARDLQIALDNKNRELDKANARAQEFANQDAVSTARWQEAMRATEPRTQEPLRGGRWPNEPMTRCFLDLDSPSYPPEESEYRQCDCSACRRTAAPAVTRELFTREEVEAYARLADEGYESLRYAPLGELLRYVASRLSSSTSTADATRKAEADK